MAWEYHIEESKIIEKWNPKKQAEEVARFNSRLNELGQQGWEMVGFNAVPLTGGFTGQQKGYAYLTFFKKHS